ncbi:DLW-39 family protein [Arsenicicoccus piscis]|uniref:Transporter n=1 Tax=Arsenicicoccus piscis TaxID=673954 RepID=A0ABQ6HV39_9MICO|nr:DLW-39 family protein [Arsenicicoccus piscis]MCH8627402.1 DLW-39 family protein [Arsenicicoccus piscis]GMA21563.1 hypothetical protein GCM10025862_35840 [Arsenicicoccus piscis]
MIKRAIVSGVLAAALVAAAQRIRAKQAEQDLWAEATDQVTR